MFISIQKAIDRGKGKVKLRGWCYRERGSNKFKFIVLRDSTNIIQCVVKRDSVSKKVWQDSQKISIEASLEVEGILKKDKRAPTGYDVVISNLKIIGLSDIYPIAKDQSSEFLLDKRHLWLRSRKLTAVMKVRHSVFGAIHEFFRKNSYYEMPPPIFTPNACEGGSTLFEVKYFKDRVYLTQSWQLYAEAAIFALEKIYCIGPCFRAERSKTSRHLAEFWMAEVEAAWIKLPELLKLSEKLVEYIVQYVVRNNKKELEFLGQDINKLKKIKAPFPRKTYTEALEILNKKEKMKIPWGKDIRTIEEDVIMKYFDKPLIVTNYPKDIMAFYKPVDTKDPKTALCFDMIAPEGYGEIIGGSQRDTDIKALTESLKKEGEIPKSYDWYFDLRKFGSVPHSGFGLGVERVVAWLCKLDNIKDAIPFPRTMMRKTP